jgi:hypothetical protein
MRLIKFTHLLALFCALSTSAAIKDAGAQCAARDVAGNPRLLADSSSLHTSATIQSATGIPVWKTIKVGTVAGKWDLHRALDAANCGIGDAAEEIFAQPEFVVKRASAETDLVIVSIAALGADAAPLKDVYARAQKLGFFLAPPEIGPQLRLQYFEQPTGEFLDIGMAPIKTQGGKSEIFVVGNGGAGLLLTGTDAHETIEFHAAARFVFVRPRNIASSQTKSD